MSIRQNFPTTPPSLVLDFANSKRLDPRITFSRTTTATRMNELGLIESVDADVARFDHKYENGVIKSLGLLVEEQRSNLFNHTEDFTQLPVSGAQDGWARGRVIPTTESVTAPDGSSGVSLLTEDNTSFGEHYVAQTGFNYTSGVTYTWSWYVKPNGRDNVYCKVYTNFDNTQVILNLETSSEYYLTVNTFDNITNTKLPNGWYRVSFTSTATSTGEGDVLLGFAQSTTVRSYTGDGSSGMYYWGAQVEAGAFPTSYIPNGTNSQATRNPDKVSMEGDNFSDWYNPSEGTLYASASILGKNIHTTGVEYPNGICKISNSGENASYSRVLYFGGNADPDRVSFGNRDSSTSTTLRDDTFGDIQSNQYYRVCGTYINNDEQALCLNGESVGYNGTNVNPPTPNQFLIGSGYNGGIAGAPIQDEMYLNGHISKLTYYPTRLSNDQLQNLTK